MNCHGGLQNEYVKKISAKSDIAKDVDHFGLCSFQPLYNGLRDEGVYIKAYDMVMPFIICGHFRRP